MLLPARMIREHLSLMGVRPSDTLILDAGDKVRDATLVGMALERAGHRGYAVLDGGYGKWVAEGRPTDVALPTVDPTEYPVGAAADRFTVNYEEVLRRMQDRSTVIIDVRPADYFAGAKSDEARAGHIPGALKRPYTKDLAGTDKHQQLKPAETLAPEYRELIPSLESPVIVHCRTGHQASQTFFVLTHLLGYRNVSWYDGGWAEWAARIELPIDSQAQHTSSESSKP